MNDEFMKLSARVLIEKCLFICDNNIILSCLPFCIKVQTMHTNYAYNFMCNYIYFDVQD